MERCAPGLAPGFSHHWMMVHGARYECTSCGAARSIPWQDAVVVRATLRRMDLLPYAQEWKKAAPGCCAFDPPIALYGSGPSGYDPKAHPQRRLGFLIRAEVCRTRPD